MSSNEDHLNTAAKAASYNVLLQLLMRASTFVLNGVILRFIQAELLGVVNLRLTLLYNTVLFISREALRKACLTNTPQPKKWRHVLNLMWCSIPMGIICSILFGILWVSPLIQQPTVPGDPLAVCLFALAALMELTAEPLWVMGQLQQYVTLKVVAEGLPQMFRCAVVVVGIVLVPHWGLMIFCAGQLAYSLGYMSIYYWYIFYRKVREEGSLLPVRTVGDLLPKTDPEEKLWMDPYLTQLSWSFLKQSFLKQLLTDGERYVMTLFAVLNFAEQGVYDVINNLGSLVARFLFKPIEESFYVFFSQMLYRGEPVEKQNAKNIPLVAETLAALLKLVLIIALVILSFGYAYSYLALDIYGGELLSSGEGPMLLRWYCVYVLLLAVNGVTECFMFAAMSQAQVDRYNQSMLLFSLVFLGSSLFLTRFLGGVGFILANCINMATRIAHSCRFIHSFFATTPHSPLLDALPSLWSIGVLFVALAITIGSEGTLCCNFGWLYRLLHIGVGVLCLGLCGMMVGFKEPNLVKFLIDRLPSNAFSAQMATVARQSGLYKEKRKDKKKKKTS